MTPLIASEAKRGVVAFVPYRKNKEGAWEFFLQLRDGNARLHPSMYSLFGGAIDPGEDVLTAGRRETMEELEYEAQHLEYFTDFETAEGRFTVYIEEVGADFESRVTVHEGVGGNFLTYEAMQREKVSPIARTVSEGLHDFKNAHV